MPGAARLNRARRRQQPSHDHQGGHGDRETCDRGNRYAAKQHRQHAKGQPPDDQTREPAESLRGVAVREGKRSNTHQTEERAFCRLRGERPALLHRVEDERRSCDRRQRRDEGRGARSPSPRSERDEGYEDWNENEPEEEQHDLRIVISDS